MLELLLEVFESEADSTADEPPEVDMSLSCIACAVLFVTALVSFFDRASDFGMLELLLSELSLSESLSLLLDKSTGAAVLDFFFLVGMLVSAAGLDSPTTPAFELMSSPKAVSNKTGRETIPMIA